jgi:hypothetical protein
MMRTTVDLPESLLKEAKQRAAREGRPLSAVIADAMRNSFARTERATATAVDLPSFKGDGLVPGVDLDDTAALLDLLERDD